MVICSVAIFQVTVKSMNNVSSMFQILQLNFTQCSSTASSQHYLSVIASIACFQIENQTAEILLIPKRSTLIIVFSIWHLEWEIVQRGFIFIGAMNESILKAINIGKQLSQLDLRWIWWLLNSFRFLKMLDLGGTQSHTCLMTCFSRPVLYQLGYTAQPSLIKTNVSIWLSERSWQNSLQVWTAHHPGGSPET